MKTTHAILLIALGILLAGCTTSEKPMLQPIVPIDNVEQIEYTFIFANNMARETANFVVYVDGELLVESTVPSNGELHDLPPNVGIGTPTIKEIKVSTSALKQIQVSINSNKLQSFIIDPEKEQIVISTNAEFELSIYQLDAGEIVGFD